MLELLFYIHNRVQDIILVEYNIKFKEILMANSYLSHCIKDKFKILRLKQVFSLNGPKAQTPKTGINFMICILIFVEIVCDT